MHDRSFEKALRESLEERSRINRQLELARAKASRRISNYRITDALVCNRSMLK